MKVRKHKQGKDYINYRLTLKRYRVLWEAEFDKIIAAEFGKIIAEKFGASEWSDRCSDGLGINQAKTEKVFKDD